jgi:hypothetical protein
MKLLYNMILLPSNAHSNVINQHCSALPVLCRALIVLLLMISGNVHVHPGPSTVASPNSDLCSDICFTDFCSRKSQGFLQVNTRSLWPNIDQLKVWVHNSNPDVLVITGIWLRKSALNADVNLSSYNLFRQDRFSKSNQNQIQFYLSHTHG